MAELEMYSRQDSLTPTGYSAVEPCQEIRVRQNRSKASPAATFPPNWRRSSGPGFSAAANGLSSRC